MKKSIAVIVQILIVAYATIFSSASSAVTCGVCSDVYTTCLSSKYLNTEEICRSEKRKCLDACYGSDSGAGESGRSSDIGFMVFIGLMILAALLYFRSNRTEEVVARRKQLEKYHPLLLAIRKGEQKVKVKGKVKMSEMAIGDLYSDDSVQQEISQIGVKISTSEYAYMAYTNEPLGWVKFEKDKIVRCVVLK
ncbi:MAG: hypothetical protein Q7J42_05420 [Sulfuritalea sp.]|nr:hypothetical protein [Sulfuritalea sp.]